MILQLEITTLGSIAKALYDCKLQLKSRAKGSFQ